MNRTDQTIDRSVVGAMLAEQAAQLDADAAGTPSGFLKAIYQAQAHALRDAALSFTEERCSKAQ